MASWHREIKEYLRILKCRFKNKPSVTTIDAEKASLVLELLSKPVAIGGENKVIWMFWDSGLENAPDVVRLSHYSWVRQNPDYQVILLDSNNLKNYLGFDFFDVFKGFSVELGAAGKSDLLRLYLLNRFGGIWADATTFCKKPLNEWLDISQSGFFCFREKKADDRQLVSWFLAAHKGNAIIQELLHQSLKYLAKPRRVSLDVRGLTSTKLLAKNTSFISRKNSGYPLLSLLEKKYCAPYFWMFYLFNEVVKKEKHKEIWNIILNMDNQYAELDDNFETFTDSVVSKQTYRQKYIEQELYLQRYQYMVNMNKNLGDIVDGK